MPHLFAFARLIGVLLVAAAIIAAIAYLTQRPSAPPEPPVDIAIIEEAALPTPTPSPARAQESPPVLRREPAAMRTVIPPPPPAPAPAPAPSRPPVPVLGDAEFYRLRSQAIIQIYCQGTEEILAASGVIVNDAGLVLTNAHVAESMRDIGPERCQARHGNPADPFAKLEAVFIASTTPKIAKTEVPQRDFAFLRLVAPKEPFARAPLSFAVADENQILRTLGYPSEFLQSITTSANSTLIFSSLTVAGYADLDGDESTAEGYVFRGGLVLQQGSSGTAVFLPSGEVAGLIFATTRAASTAEREGIALLVPYIDSVLRAETGQGIEEFIAGH